MEPADGQDIRTQGDGDADMADADADQEGGLQVSARSCTAICDTPAARVRWLLRAHLPVLHLGCCRAANPSIALLCD